MPQIFRSGSVLVMAVLAALFLSVHLSAQEKENTDLTVTGRVQIKGEDKSAAREKAMKATKTRAVKEHVSTLLPPGILKTFSDDINKLADSPDDYVKSWEVLEEKEEEGDLVVKAVIALDKNRLATALKSMGALPPGKLPKVFLVVPGNIIDEEMPSMWDKTSGRAGRFNSCEAQIAKSLYRYGFEVVEPGVYEPGVDTDMLTAPENEDEREKIFQTLWDRFKSPVLVVGRARTEEKDPEIEASLRIAIADVRDRKVVWADKSVEMVDSEDDISGTDAVTSLCMQAGAQVVEVLFDQSLPEQSYGEMKAIKLVLTGVKNYGVVTKLLERLKRDGPGVDNASLSSARHSEIELEVMTTADSKELSRWVEGQEVEGFSFTTEFIDEKEVRVDVR